MLPKEKPVGVSDASWAIWLDVKANSKKLDECVGPHEFSQVGPQLFSKWACAKCGGMIDTVNARWYKLGMVHAAASAGKVAT